MSAPFAFWMVKGDGPASHIHGTRLSAEREAQRLARQHPGTLFYVMQAIAAHRKIDVERFDLSADAAEVEAMTDDDEIPF